jgi:hypothetical protein
MRGPPPGLLTPFTIRDSALLSQETQITVALRGVLNLSSLRRGTIRYTDTFLPQT